MTEKVLPYNRDLVPQETGWWCGPASAQTVLNTREIHFDESWLAQQCNTHEGGTDYIGQITAVLNEYVHDADYITVDLPLDPPSDPSSSSDSASWESILAADAALGPMPGVSFANIYAGQLLLKRSLDRMSAQVNNMQLQLDSLNVEVAHIKRRRT